MNKLETNVLILGKSGVGKSSFINYIYGENIREKGAGRPVTGKNLYKVKHELENITVNIYDTWGLEANKTTDWKSIVLDEVKKHNEQLAIKDWFHTIYYCFSASTARIEDFEIEDILKPLIRDGNRVTLIITHCDVRGAEEKSQGMIDKLLKVLPIDESDIIKVSSERKKLLGGKIKEAFGKEEVLAKLKNNLWDDIKTKIPIQYESYITNEIKEWRNKIQSKIEYILNQYEFKYTLSYISKYINEDLKSVLSRIDKVTKQYISETYMYYVTLVKYIHIDISDVDSTYVFNDFKCDIDDNMAIGYKILDFLDNGIVWGLPLIFRPINILIFIPGINILAAPIGMIAVKLGKSHMKKKIVESVDLQYSELLASIPNLKNELELFMNNMDKEQLLLL